jgi:Folate-sensitive fragile site protein Fra10Ac1
MRWRTQAEVLAGKGQFVCGARGCDTRAGLCSYEVPFAYEEAGQHKQALVKLRLCSSCGGKLLQGRGSASENQRTNHRSHGRDRSRTRSRSRSRGRHRRRSHSPAREDRRGRRSNRQHGSHSTRSPLAEADIDAWLDGLFRSDAG